MKRLLLLFTVLLLTVSCSGRRHVEQALNSGNYDHAISTALNKLERNKHSKRKQAYIAMLQSAYNKVVERDLEAIDRLERTENPEFFNDIYNLYIKLDNRQEAIKPILPLRIDGRFIAINFNDYSNQIITYQNKVSQYYYTLSKELMSNSNKLDYREAYELLSYIDKINPNYRDIRQLMREAHLKGSDFVFVSLENRTGQIIPQQLENELLALDTYGLNDFWTVYHSTIDSTINYDYAMHLQFNRILISPEQIKERQLLRQREIVDGWEYVLDENGNVEKDSLGNDIKIDKLVTIRARFFEVQQLKVSQVVADVIYKDLKTAQTLDVFTINSGFEFNNLFGRYRGDKRALTQKDLDIINNPRVPFPTNEQMVYHSGENLKLKFKNIIASSYN